MSSQGRGAFGGTRSARGWCAVAAVVASALAILTDVVLAPVMVRAETAATAKPPPVLRMAPQGDIVYLDALTEAARRYFPDAGRAVPDRRIYRLTREQIDATVAAVLPGYAPGSIKAVMNRDPLQTNYEYAELLSFNEANIAALAKWIGTIVAAVKGRPDGVIACRDVTDEACLSNGARSFLLKAFRGDVAESKLAQMTRFYLDGVKKIGFAPATAELVEVTLNSPDFLFRKELAVDRYRQLSPAQLLQALTYTIADVPPHAIGFDPANPAQHLTEASQAKATVDAVVNSTASRQKLTRFFKAWLEIREPDDFTISTELYPEFDDKLARAMIEETRRFLAAQLAKPEPKLSDITQATETYVPAGLGSIYRDDASTEAQAKAKAKAKATTPSESPVMLDPERRLGIFSQPAVIASHSGPTGTRPIKRGVFWVRKVMCMELEPPPQGLDTTIPKADHTTERQRITQSTALPACQGCHKLIDPFGFFQESYDALGRWRTTDNGFPVDTKIAIDFLDEGPFQTTSAVEALKVFTSSMMFKQCFVRQLFRFYMGRNEEPGDDPLLRGMFLDLALTDDLLATVRTLATSSRIARRW